MCGRFFVVLCLLAPVHALKFMDEKPPKARVLKEVLPSTTRAGKAYCTSASDIEEGTWVALKEGEFLAGPQNNHSSSCNPQKMMWEPNKCKLPYLSEEVSAPGRIVLIGDSITDNAARSFAWYREKLWSKNLNACMYNKDDVKLRLRQVLRRGKFKQATIETTLNYVYEQGFRKNHHWWGCNSSVLYVPTDAPPPRGTSKAFLYAVQHFPVDKPLGPEDTIVINWGAWEKEDQAGEWFPSMNIFMKEYGTWQKEGTAPKLIWREMSPMHWGAAGTTYSKKAFEETQTTSQGCSPSGGPKQMAAQLNKKGEFPLRNTDMFKGAAKAAGLKVDGVKMEFLPIWRGSAERYEDHQPLSKYQKAKFATVDCTHFCVHGNVHRYWNSALVAIIAAMHEKQVSSALELSSTKEVLEQAFLIGKT